MSTVISELAELKQILMDGNPKSWSLSGAARKSNIFARVYIEERIANDDISPDLMTTLNQLYTGFILTALNFNVYVRGNKLLSDALQSVMDIPWMR